MVTETQSRQLVASFGVVWVYSVAQSEGDFGAASSALAFFQRTWSSTRAVILANAGDPTAADRIVPRGLSVTGGWDADTRRAVSYTIEANLGPDLWTAAEFSAVPTTAGGIASWFTNRFEPLVSRNISVAAMDILLDFEALLDEDATLLQSNLQAMTTQVLSGVRVGEPEVIAAGNDPARSVIDATGSSGAVADAADAASEGSGASIDAGGTAIEVDPGVIIGYRRTAPTWQYAVIGLGALAFGGLAYYLWLYRQRRSAA